MRTWPCLVVVVAVACGGRVLEQTNDSRGTGGQPPGAGGSPGSGAAVVTGSGGRSIGVGGAYVAGTGGYDPYGSTGGSSGYGGAPCSPPPTTAYGLDGPNVWNGVNTHIDDVSIPGYWYSFYDGSSAMEVFPTNTSFAAGIVNGFIEASGTGIVTGYGGGIAANFVEGSPTPVADLSPYKGIVFQFKASKLYGARFVVRTWDFDPAYCVCSASSACGADYGADIPPAVVADTVVSYFTCWPGFKCSGPGGDVAAQFPNVQRLTLESPVGGGNPFIRFDPKRVLGLSFQSLDKSQWRFAVGRIRLF